MKSKFHWRVLSLTSVFAILLLSAFAVAVYPDTPNSFISTKTKGLLEPETFFLLLSGVIGMVYLVRQKKGSKIKPISTSKIEP